MKRHWSLPNLLATGDTCLRDLMADMKKGKYDEALEKAERMRKNIARIKTHCRECDERIVDEI